jgi:hypothetical protein
MGYPVYYDGEVRIAPPLTEDDASVLLAVSNLEQTEGSRAVFAAIEASLEPDLPYHFGLLEISEDRTCILPESEESRHGLRMWLRLLIEHFLAPRGYLLNGEIQWTAADDNEDRGGSTSKTTNWKLSTTLSSIQGQAGLPAPLRTKT